MRILTIALMTFLLLAMSGCGEPVGSGVHQYNPELGKDCMGCDLSGADLTGANLSHVDLSSANLDGVIGADFSRAKNVPPKYLND